ncbi:MAG: hypothetical protein IKR96_00405 [Bacteroidales bacterium]|nr:hypothetical protein [Bacteroidales bacterium]
MKQNYTTPLAEVEQVRLEHNFLGSFHDTGAGTPNVDFDYDDDTTFA